MPRTDLFAKTERPAIALDSGSSSIKIGFCGEETPRAVVPTTGLEEANGAVPLKAGVVQDWEAMEVYWDHAFTHALGVDTEACHVITTAHLFETKLNKERMAQSLFESFAVAGVFLSAPPVFELYAAGKESGVVLGCGAECTYAVLLHEGLPDPRTMLRGSVAGQQLTAHAATVLEPASLPAESAEAAKRAVGAVSAAAGGAADAPCSFELPDGRSIEVSASARAAIAEPLFEPSRVGGTSGGLAELVADCIRARDRDGVLESTVHGRDGTGAWYGQVVLAGGTSTLPGLPERLSAELTRYAPHDSPAKVTALEGREHAAWLGASILGSLGVMPPMWVSKQEYDENGPLIVHRKCF
mmetsp:Transcript_69/g.184  ORF Transcript_69/g.184 Transcript_69/m.184 type:complete len:356 (+) Transcript_69:55-1122(+)